VDAAECASVDSPRSLPFHAARLAALRGQGRGALLPEAHDQGHARDSAIASTEWEAEYAELLQMKAELAEIKRELEIRKLLRLRSELAAIKAELALRQLLRTAKAYNPNQPRVPAGSREGGQWTNGSGGTLSRQRDNLTNHAPASGQRTRVAELASPSAVATDASGSQFSRNGSGWHDYTAGPNLVCRAELMCSREEMADQLARFSVPGRDPANPVQHLDTSLVREPRTGIPGGWVRTRIEDDGLTIISQTTPAHVLYDGVVIRSARQADDRSWYVTTRGIENNILPGMNLLNQEQGPLIFNILDQRLRDNIERHRAKGTLSLAMRRVGGYGYSRGPGLFAGSYHVR